MAVEAALNIRGTSGSGKSHLVRRIRDMYAMAYPQMETGRRQPIGYICQSPRSDVRDLFIVGHYETPCGGCDTINGLDIIYEHIEDNLLAGRDVIFEGLIVASDVRRCASLMDIAELLVIGLNTPIEKCLEGIQARRDGRGDDRPLNPANTQSKMRSVFLQGPRFLDLGVDYRYLDREEAFAAAKAHFGWK